MIFMRNYVLFLMLVGLAACTAAPVHAATYLVMQDGTGDFEQIQPALNAVASGDTLIIGPGEYTESQPTQIPGFPWEVGVFCYIPVYELTIIGSGIDETVVGPITYEGSSSTYSPKGLVWLGGGALRVSDLTVRNCYSGIYAINAPVFVDNCRFFDNGIGVFWKLVGHGGVLSNCSFFAETPGESFGAYIFGSGSGAIVEDCQFEGSQVSVNSIDGISFFRCGMREPVVGIQIDNGA